MIQLDTYYKYWYIYWKSNNYYFKSHRFKDEKCKYNEWGHEQE